MNCPYDDMGCIKVDTSGMDKPECKDCKHYVKRIVCIASIPDRERMLQKTADSLRYQVDEIYVTLNDYDHIPDFLKGNHTVILDNSMGDAGKFYFVEKLKGYILTCDDDLIYPYGYVDYMVKKVKQYKSPCTLHGRNYSRPVVGFQYNFTGYPCLDTVEKDTIVDVGGDGVMCWHTDDLKVKFSDFKQKNMSQLYFSKLCREQDKKIYCLAHRVGYLGYMNPKWTIWDEERKNNFERQTVLLKEFLK